MTAVQRMTKALADALGEAQIHIDDDSAKHVGHAGAAPGGETHFRVRIISPAFRGLSRVDRHRLVNAAMAAEFNDRLHALALTTLTPEEAAKV